MSKDLECPYCDEGNDVCHDDGQGYDEGKAHEMECDHCGKSFVFHTAISYYYTPERADCLNGSPHNFREWRILWESKAERLEDRTCRDCGHSERRSIPIKVQTDQPITTTPQ